MVLLSVGMTALRMGVAISSKGREHVEGPTMSICMAVPGVSCMNPL